MYAQHLQSFNVPVKTIRYSSFIHRFVHMIRVVEEVKYAVHEIADNYNLQQMFNSDDFRQRA